MHIRRHDAPVQPIPEGQGEYQEYAQHEPYDESIAFSVLFLLTAQVSIIGYARTLKTYCGFFLVIDGEFQFLSSDRRTVYRNAAALLVLVEFKKLV